MRIPRLYTPQNLLSGDSIALDDAAAHYLTKVLRMQPGRELVLFNGAGGEFSAHIASVTKKTLMVNVGEHRLDNRESPLQLELAIGISRGERMDWVIQKATELGVTQITPLITERTEVKLAGERQDKKMQHWQQIIISACEQSQRNLLPLLNEPQSITDWLSHCSAQQRFVLHHRDNQRLTAEKKSQSLALLIGPEGGLTDAEISRAIEFQFTPLTLGPRVLRTETAPIAAISLVQYLWGDF